MDALKIPAGTVAEYSTNGTAALNRSAGTAAQ